MPRIIRKWADEETGFVVHQVFHTWSFRFFRSFRCFVFGSNETSSKWPQVGHQIPAGRGGHWHLIERSGNPLAVMMRQMMHQKRTANEHGAYKKDVDWNRTLQICALFVLGMTFLFVCLFVCSFVRSFVRSFVWGWCENRWFWCQRAKGTVG